MRIAAEYSDDMCSMPCSAKVALSAMPAPYPHSGVGRNELEAVVLLQALDEAVELDVVGAQLPLLTVLLDGDGVALARLDHLHWRPPLLVDEAAGLVEDRIVAPPGHCRDLTWVGH